MYYVFARFGAFMAVVTIQAGDADSSGAPGFTTDPLTEPVAFKWNTFHYCLLKSDDVLVPLPDRVIIFFTANRVEWTAQLRKLKNRVACDNFPTNDICSTRQQVYFIRTNSGTSVKPYGLLLLTLYVLNNPFVPFVKTHNLRHISLLVNYLNGGPFCSKFHRRRSNFLAHGMIWRFLRVQAAFVVLLIFLNFYGSHGRCFNQCRYSNLIYTPIKFAPLVLYSHLSPNFAHCYKTLKCLWIKLFSDYCWSKSW